MKVLHRSLRCQSEKEAKRYCKEMTHLLPDPSLEKIKIDDSLSLEIIKESDTQNYFDLAIANKKFFINSQTAIGNLDSIEKATSLVKAQVSEYNEGQGINYKILYDNHFIGRISIRSINWEHKKAIIGYFLAESYSGKGIMKKCLEKILEIGFKELKLNRLSAHTSTQNQASNKLLQKCGFKLEGCLRKDFFVNGQFVDDNVYGLLSEEYKFVKKIKDEHRT